MAERLMIYGYNGLILLIPIAAFVFGLFIGRAQKYEAKHTEPKMRQKLIEAGKSPYYRTTGR